MPLHIGRSSGEHQDQLREARRFLQDHVRNDWSYPDAPHVLPFDYPTSSTAGAAPEPSRQGDATAQVNAHIDSRPTTTTTPLSNFTATGWRERTYSDGEDSDSSDDAATPVYETPDSVGTSLSDRKSRRRRRRQQRLQEEITWNIGLAHWSAQRNAWTGAQQRDDSNTSDPKPHPVSHTSADQTGALPDTSLVIPVAPNILPHHPVRSRITSSTHGEIYTKIILQGRTPSIPINLQDITNSLIHGWKEEGNWPPKPTPAEASFTMRRGDARGHPHLRKGVQAVGRVLGFGSPGVPVERVKGEGQGQG